VSDLDEKEYHRDDHENTLLAHHLTTVEILYHMADYPDLQKTFVCQHMDIASDYPRLHKFPDYWQDNFKGRLDSFAVAADALNVPCKIDPTKAEFQLH